MSSDDAYTLGTADAVIDRLRLVYGAESDTALAAALGVAKNTVSNWRGRNSRPFPICERAALERGISLDWLLLGRGPPEAEGAERANGPGRVEDMGEELYRVQMPGQGDQDPRLEAILSWLRTWWATAEADERTWLVVELRRTFPELADWFRARGPP